MSPAKPEKNPMTLNGVRAWFKVIDEHYAGDLGKFEDTTTVRHMLSQVRGWQEFDANMLLEYEVYPEEHALLVKQFEDDRAYAGEKRAELEDWLSSRGRKDI